jgi:hypothetical protein
MAARPEPVTRYVGRYREKEHVAILQGRAFVSRKDHGRVRLSPTRLISLLVHTPRHVLHIGAT